MVKRHFLKLINKYDPGIHRNLGVKQHEYFPFI